MMHISVAITSEDRSILRAKKLSHSNQFILTLAAKTQKFCSIVYRFTFNLIKNDLLYVIQCVWKDEYLRP